MLLLQSITAALLLFALAELPYGYYTFLRIITTIAAASTAINFFDKHQENFAWGFIIIAILFNPIIPIHLSKDTWQAIDVSCAGLFGFLIFMNYKKNKQKLEKQNNNSK